MFLQQRCIFEDEYDFFLILKVAEFRDADFGRKLNAFKFAKLKNKVDGSGNKLSNKVFPISV